MGDQIWTAGGTTASYCCIQGSLPADLTDAGGNIDLDPLFVNPPFDYSVSPLSPCIDAGNSNATGLSGITEDLDGSPRFVNDPEIPDTGLPDAGNFVVDIGAYEYQIPCPADITENGNVNVSDLLELLATWGPCEKPCPSDFNTDGSVNVTDLLQLLAAWGLCPLE